MSESFMVEPSNQDTIDNSTNHVENQDQPFLSVGERVFKTKDDVVKKIENADNHIKTVEKNYEEALSLVAKQEEMLTKSSRIEELMEALAKRRESSGQAEETASLNKDDLIADAIKAFDQLQNQRKSVEVQQSNWDTVRRTLTDAYADKTNEVVQKVAAENDLTLEQAKALAMSSPKVFLRMFDLSNKRAAATVNSSTVNTESFGTVRPNKPSKPIMNMSIKERAAYVKSRLAELQD